MNFIRDIFNETINNLYYLMDSAKINIYPILYNCIGINNSQKNEYQLITNNVEEFESLINPVIEPEINPVIEPEIDPEIELYETQLTEIFGKKFKKVKLTDLPPHLKNTLYFKEIYSGLDTAIIPIFDGIESFEDLYNFNLIFTYLLVKKYELSHKELDIIIDCINSISSVLDISLKNIDIEKEGGFYIDDENKDNYLLCIKYIFTFFEITIKEGYQNLGKLRSLQKVNFKYLEKVQEVIFNTKEYKKSISSFEELKFDLIKAYMKPTRVIKFLESGKEISDLDEF